MSDSNEKRHAPRVEERVPIQIIESGGDIAVETKNISASGAYFITDKLMPIMSRVMITLLIPDADKKNNKLECEGTVVRATPTSRQDKTFYETAVFFNDITEKAKNTIVKHIKNIMAET